jgi:hypothetical protein
VRKAWVFQALAFGNFITSLRDGCRRLADEYGRVVERIATGLSERGIEAMAALTRG